MLTFRLLSVAEITTIHPHPVDANNLGQRQHTARQPPQLRKPRGQKWGGWGSQGQWKANCCINLANKKNKRNMAANQDKHGNHHVHPTDKRWHRRSDFLLLLRNSLHQLIPSFRVIFQLGDQPFSGLAVGASHKWVLLGWQWFIASKSYRTSRRTNCGVCVPKNCSMTTQWLRENFQGCDTTVFIANVFHPGTIFFDAKKKKRHKIRRTS